MKDYYLINKLNKKNKEKEVQFFGWVITIILVLGFLYFAFSISGAGMCEDVISGKCVP